MKIDDNYWIEQDNYNVILRYEEKTGEINPKTEKEVISTGTWYYKNLKDALRGYSQRRVDYNEDVYRVLAQLEQVEATISKFQTTKK